MDGFTPGRCGGVKVKLGPLWEEPRLDYTVDIENEEKKSVSDLSDF